MTVAVAGAFSGARRVEVTMAEAVLVIDQGTTGSTALVLSREGTVLGRAYAELPQYFPQPGWVEHDPEEIWRVSLAVMRSALAVAGLRENELAAIGITNQRETTIVWDRASGTPVHRAIVWQSRQTAAICDRLKKEGREPLIRERTGLVIDAYFSGTKIRWLLDHLPDGRSRAESGELAFGTVDTWLLWKLTGGEEHATDPTNASRTLLYDIRRQRWDDELLGILGVPRPLLPEVRPSSSVFGLTRGETGLPAGVPVAGIAGDQQAALYGQGCWQPGMAKSTYGTGCFVLMHMGAQSSISSGGLLTTAACDAEGRTAFALEGAIFVAGAAVQWLRDELRLIGNAGETDAVARSVASTGGVYVVPAFAGLGAPYWDMGARGAIVGLTRGSSRAQIVRATLESIAYQTRDVVGVMNRDALVPIRELRVDGGAAANDFLMQFQADILGVPVDRPALVETTATGAAFLAGLAVGLWQSPAEIAGVRRRERLFEPRMGGAERDRLYAGWQEAVDRVLSRPHR
jgi:glycerol kinase